jgi:hypothetical protein
VLAVFFWPALSPHVIFFTHDLGGSDLLHQNLPFREVLVEALRHGGLPFWAWDMGTGFPLLAEGQVAALYPPNLLLLWLLPLPLAVNLFVLLHLFLGGLFSAIYARTLGLGLLPATFAALVFALCGFMVVHVRHVNMVAAAAWAPLFFALIEGHMRTRRPARSGAAVAFVVAMMILAGHPQLAYDTLLLGALYAAARGLRLARLDAWRPAAGRLSLLLAGVALGVGLAAPQLLPTLELVGESNRSQGVSWQEATRYGYHPRHLITFLLPYHFGGPADDSWPKLPEQQERLWPGIRTVFWEITGYVGWVPLLLAFLALVFALRGRLRGPPGPRPGVAAAVLLLVLGRFTPVYRLFYVAVPGFDAFRFPTRFLVYADLFLAVLAAIGLELAGRRLAPRARVALGLGLTLVAVGDLFWFGRGHNRVADAERWLDPPPLARDLAAEAQPYRILTLDSSSVWERANALAGGWQGSLEPYFATRNLPIPNANLSYGLPSLEFYTSFYPERLELTRRLPSRTALRLAGVWNVKYVISPRALRHPLLAERGVYPGPVYLYENRAAMPRAFLAFAVQRHPDLAAVETALRSPGFDPAVVHVEDPSGHLAEPAGPAGRPVPAREVFRGRDRVEFETDADRPAVFFASELYYPGRSAEVDGEPVELVPADGVGVALFVPEGRHRVTLRYRSRPFERGRWIAAASGCALVLLALRPAGSGPWGRR